MNRSAADIAPVAPRQGAWRVLFAALLAVACAGFCALGSWQVQRLAWKRDLIARVDARLRAEPAPPPSRSAWPAIDTGSEYLRVRLSGQFLDVPPARTQAVTGLGAGWWLLSPLRTEAGDIVLVNRGFVPADGTASPPPRGTVEITGLLRMSEPGGGFLRRNVPREDRWYSRDVAAIAAARGLPTAEVAPFFVDAGYDHADAGWPRGGMTVVRFRNQHLQYALTWFGLALVAAAGGILLFVHERRLRQHRRRPLGESRHARTPTTRG